MTNIINYTKRQLSGNWLKQKVRVDVYLYNEGYRTAAIYGIGYMGKCLMSELTKTESKIEVFVLVALTVICFKLQHSDSWHPSDIS